MVETLSVVSIVLAVIAIGASVLSEWRGRQHYDRTQEVLSDIKEKAAVIDSVVSGTQEKLLGAVTDLVRPQRETQDEMLMRTLLPAIVQNPNLLEQIMKWAQEQEKNNE